MLSSVAKECTPFSKLGGFFHTDHGIFSPTESESVHVPFQFCLFIGEKVNLTSNGSCMDVQITDSLHNYFFIFKHLHNYSNLLFFVFREMYKLIINLN